MKRIYHNHNKWEEVKYGMYKAYSNEDKPFLLKKVVLFFNNEMLVKKYMKFVVDNFKFSCEHIFTNPSMNHIAWLGQSSIAVWGGVPEEITREGWSLLNEETQNRANEIVIFEIERWKGCQKSI